MQCVWAALWYRKLRECLSTSLRRTADEPASPRKGASGHGTGGRSCGQKVPATRKSRTCLQGYQNTGEPALLLPVSHRAGRPTNLASYGVCPLFQRINPQGRSPASPSRWNWPAKRGRCRPPPASSAPTALTREPPSCWPRLPPRPRTGNLLDIGCGWGPIALTMALRAPHAQRLRRGRQRALHRTDERERRPARAGQRRGQHPGRRGPGRPLRHHLVQPAHPDRQGRTPLAPARCGCRGWPRAVPPGWWCRRTWARIRFSAGSPRCWTIPSR